MIEALYAETAKRDLLTPEARGDIESGPSLSALGLHHANVPRSAWHAALLDLFELCDVHARPTTQAFHFRVEDG